MKPSKKLIDHWYNKLKKSGFKDAEYNETYMHQYAGYFKAKFTPEMFQEKLDYYQMISHLLETAEFKNLKEKRIWALHCQAIGIRPIAEIISRQYRRKIGKDKVHQIILDLKARFKKEGRL